MENNIEALNVEVKPAAKLKEAAAKYLFLLCGIVSILALLTITAFLFIRGIPGIAKVGFFEFLFGTKWDYRSDQYGIFPMIVGSLYITAGSLLIGVPLGIFTAAFMTHFCKGRLKRILKQVVNLLVGIPSIIYGFFGLVVLLPLSSELARRLGFGGASGHGVLISSIVLGIMILPTIVNISAAAIEAVPKHYYEGAVALGATHEQAVFKVVLPAAKSGVFTSVALGLGRAIGETMAVVMVAGNAVAIPDSIFHPVRTLTTGIVIEMSYAVQDSLHYDALISIGLVLFVFTLVLYTSINLYRNRNSKRGKK